MPNNDDVFKQGVSQSGSYYWSNTGNWVGGEVPTNGATVDVTDGESFDDLPSLTLAALNLSVVSSGFTEVDVTHGTLNIGAVQGGSETELDADGGYLLASTQPATVTVGNITGSGAFYGAIGAESKFIDNSTSDSGNNYFALDGGTVELAAAPLASSTLQYSLDPSNSGLGTIELEHPTAGGPISTALENISGGDVLELPGNITSVTIGTNSLEVSTSNDGNYDFTNVSYLGSITGYTITPDSSTGLDAITFTVPDQFQQSVVETAGPLEGDYLWSTPANWSNGLPIDGATVNTSTQAVDDLFDLSLNTLNLSGATSGVRDIGGNLSIGTLTGSGSLIADGSVVGAPVNVTVNNIATAGGTFGAVGPTSTFIDNSSIDPGATYESVGGMVELAAAPASTSQLEFDGPGGTFALEHPQGLNSVSIEGLGLGDTLEVPGTLVKSVTIGTNSLDISTDQGNFDFTNVQFANQLEGYTASFDSSTGLEAITFPLPDQFVHGTAATSGAVPGGYLWSTAANWNDGIPGNGAAVTAPLEGYDDLSNLSLTSLDTATAGDVHVISNNLNVGIVSGSGSLVAEGDLTNTTTTVTVGDITTSGGHYGAVGTTSTFIDNSAVDIGETFTASSGVVEIAAKPAGASHLEYGSAGSTFVLEHPLLVNTVEIDQLAAGDVLELPGTTVTKVTFGAESLEVFTDKGTFDFTDVNYKGSVDGYTASYDSVRGFEALTFTACYLRGTRIRTDQGEVAIESLRIGDLVMTLSGQLRPIRWIGRRRYPEFVAADNLDILPIRIQACSLGNGLPRADLWVSPEHAMYIDGMLIPAHALINGMTIVQEHSISVVEYFHLEFDAHEIIFAEGAASESYADDGDRFRFDNAAEYWTLYPNDSTAPTRLCAPRVEDGFELEDVRQRLNRSAADDLGFAHAHRDLVALSAAASSALLVRTV